MPHYILRLVQLVAFGVLVTRASKINYKVCTTKLGEDCRKLEHPIKCDYNPSVKNCSEKIDKGNDTFGVINGSDVYAVGRFKENLIVVAEFIDEHHSNDQKFQHEFVVFATNGIKNVEDLRGTTLCHPGLYVSNVDTDLLAKFDLKLCDIINKKCHLDLDARLQFLSNFFGPSCIPGKWTSDSTLDTELKKRYNKLVKLCSNDHNENVFDQSFNCLLNATKGVALTTLDTVEKYKTRIVLLDYCYICPNGAINDINNSCRWFAQPLSIIVANKNLAGSLPSDLKKWFEEFSSLKSLPSDLKKRSVDLDPESKKNLKHVIFPTVQYKINVINHAPPIVEYISGLNAPSPDLCSKTNITWCTTSPDKNDDCKWFSAKNINFHLDCETQKECMTSLWEKKTNFVIIPADAAFAMSNKFTPIVGLGYKLHSLIVVNLDVKDLKNQIGCFDKYEGTAWFLFIKVARNPKLKMDATCEKPYLNACETNGPGISNCDKKLEGSPLKYLKKPGYYVVTNEAVNSDANYTILCQNGTFIQQTGLNVDEDCYLSIVSSDLVVTRKDEPAIEDIKWIVSQLSLSKVEDNDSDSSTNIGLYSCTLLLITAIPIFFSISTPIVLCV